MSEELLPVGVKGTDLITLDLDLQKSEELMGDSIKVLIMPGEELVIASKDDMNLGVLLIADIKDAATLLEKVRKQRVDPHNKELKIINGFFKKFIGELEDAEKLIKKKILDFDELEKKKRRDREAELQRIEDEKKEKDRKLKEAQEASKEADEGGSDITEEQANILKEEPAEEKIDIEAEREKLKKEDEKKTHKFEGVSSTVKENWKFEVTDFSKIGAPYLMVNEKVVQAAVNSGVRELEGFRIYPEKNLSIRR